MQRSVLASVVLNVLSFLECRADMTRIVVPNRHHLNFPHYAGIAQNGNVNPFPPAPGGATNGDYQCVPAGTCPGGSGDDGIDIRIVTPGQLCPTGQVPCYYQCGVRKVNLIATADGVTTEGAYPWQAYLEVGNRYVGSGVLLNRYYVLTAAHKVYESRNNPGNVRVTMGVYNPANMVNVQQSTASRITIHEQYTEQPKKLLLNDIAIIRLQTPINVVTNPNIGVACLPVSGQTFTPGQECMVAGWGETGFMVNDAPTSPQKQVTVPIVSISECRQKLSTVMTNVDEYLDQTGGEICAGGQSMRDACTLDGGAPLVCANANGRYSVAGLVIWGKGCGREGIPGVYVSVPFYSTWIQQEISQG